MNVGRAHREPPATSRPNTAQVHLEITALIKKGGRGTHTALAAHLGMDTQQLSHKLAKSRAEWRIEDLQAVADFFNAPPGWPLAPLHVLSAMFGRGHG